jgi:hypothetical protein
MKENFPCIGVGVPGRSLEGAPLDLRRLHIVFVID